MSTPPQDPRWDRKYDDGFDYTRGVPPPQGGTEEAHSGRRPTGDVYDTDPRRWGRMFDNDFDYTLGAPPQQAPSHLGQVQPGQVQDPVYGEPLTAQTQTSRRYGR